MPIQIILYEMEQYGMPIDTDRLKNLENICNELMMKLKADIFSIVGSFNIESPKLVAKALGLQSNSTTKEVLQKCENPAAKLIIQYRQLGNVLSKFVYTFLHKIKNERLHPNSDSFTSTGRISMFEPSLQNTPKNFEIKLANNKTQMISCRNIFHIYNGRCFLTADFCQLELRILAHLSKDKALINIMKDQKEDIFIKIASGFYKKLVSDVTDIERNNAKQICYGIIYGMGIKTLSNKLNTNEDEAKLLTERFYSTYPGIRNYTDEIVNIARKNGFVQTLLGHRRYLPKINSNVPHEVAQAERQAINTTIQGSAAEISKLAMIKMDEKLKKYKSQLEICDDDGKLLVNLVLHMHDELIYEVPSSKVKQIAHILEHSMENSARLSIPLPVKMKTGVSWGELTEI